MAIYQSDVSTCVTVASWKIITFSHWTPVWGRRLDISSLIATFFNDRVDIITLCRRLNLSSQLCQQTHAVSKNSALGPSMCSGQHISLKILFTCTYINITMFSVHKGWKWEITDVVFSTVCRIVVLHAICLSSIYTVLRTITHLFLQCVDTVGWFI